MFLPPIVWWIGGAIAVVVVLIALANPILGFVLIGRSESGIVYRRFGGQLGHGKIIALNGEAGWQANMLPPGMYFGLWGWMYMIKRVPMMNIPAGEIGLVVAKDGESIPAGRILGRMVPCDSFQDARTFLTKGGERGRQMGILTTGLYRINTELFEIITTTNATKYGLDPSWLRVYQVMADMVGIVTTLDGYPIPEGEIAGPIVEGHSNFQDPHSFIAAKGCRGLQEQVLLSGSWNLNPWFVNVEQVKMTTIPIGSVGVVISYVGKPHEDISGAGFKHGDLVNQGVKGVWVKPLYPGKHPVNPRIMDVELVPTTNIVLNWADRTESHRYDTNLSSITVRSRDGFGFDLDVSQIIHVSALEAPKVISRVGTVQNLVDNVLQPIIGNYFRNAAQNYTVLDFLSERSKRQAEATVHIANAVRAYDVEAIDTLIGDIVPPADLMHTLTERKLAEEQQKTYEVQQAAQTQRQNLVRETAIADIQNEVVKAERGVNIAELQANAQIKQATGEAEAIRLRATGEAESIRLRGEAQAAAYTAGTDSLGGYGFTAVQLMEIIAQGGVKIVPDISVTGSGNSAQGGGTLSDALIAMLLRNETEKTNDKPAKPNGQPAPRPTNVPPTNPNTPITHG
jgi:uncharacterized membrane protein YqiK